MQTSEIETYADIGGISGPDIDLKALLRRKVVPAFFTDVGYPSWRRMVATLNLTAVAGKKYDLPNDCGVIQVVRLNTGKAPVQYIGEDPDKVIAAELNTTAGEPTGYYFDRKADGTLGAIKFNSTPDQNYSAVVIYYSYPYFADTTSSVDMNKYIPTQFQWGLVEGLKKDIMFIRYGIGDPRYVAAEQEFQMWIERADQNKELARRNLPVFASS